MSKFPVLFAGQRLTATLAGQMEPDTYRKTSSTIRASTTTTTDDPDLSIPVDANTIVLCEFFIKYATTTAAGFKTVWNVPALTTGNRQVQGLGTGAVDNSTTSFTARQGVHGFSTAVTWGSRNDVSLQVWAYEWAEVTVGATAGNVALGWGQNASTAVNTVVVSGSIARKTQIG